MNNLQYIVKDSTRFAMHIAVELCEQGDFDSVSEAFRWLNQETVDNFSWVWEPKWTLQGKTQTQEFWRCECSNCGYVFGAEDRSTSPFKMTINEVNVPNFCPECGVKQKVVENAEH